MQNESHRFSYARRRSRQVMLGPVAVGGDAPVSIQSMTNTVTADREATLAQIGALYAAGCHIVRVAVVDAADVSALYAITAASPLPVVADIHYDYKLAVGAIGAGVAGLRINPGNIGDDRKVREVVLAARERLLPIRIGVNGGSLEAALLDKHGGPTAAALVESALGHVAILEDMAYREIKISLKSSHVPVMLEAYREIAARTDYALHVGLTEAGLASRAIVVSAVGIGTLLAEGIGDTVRVSVTGDPVQEVLAARRILSALDLAPAGLQIVSCPTCGRTRVDLPALASAAEEKLADIPLPEGRSLTVAIMGCPVNGPGEAKDADFGIACGKGAGVLFAGGRQIVTLPEADLLDALYELVKGDLWKNS